MTRSNRNPTPIVGAVCLAAVLVASPALGQTPSPPPDAGPSAWVHVDGADGASLQQDVSGDDDWKTICHAPCDQLAPVGFWYRIAGRKVLASDDFTLDAPAGGRTEIHVAAASKPWRTAGDFLVGAGFLTALIGGYVLYFHYAPDAVADAENKPRPTTPDPVIGFVLAGIGGLVGIVGLVPVVANYQTTVTQTASSAPAPTTPPPPAAAATGAAAWSTPESRRVPPVFGIPILAGSF